MAPSKRMLVAAAGLLFVGTLGAAAWNHYPVWSYERNQLSGNDDFIGLIFDAGVQTVSVGTSNGPITLETRFGEEFRFSLAEPDSLYSWYAARGGSPAELQAARARWAAAESTPPPDTLVSPSLAWSMWFILWAGIGAGIALRTAVAALNRQQVAQARAEREAREAADGFEVFLEKQLAAVTERERTNMLRADYRASLTYAVGVMMLVASVFAPVTSAYVYFRTDPLPAESLERLAELANSAGGAIPAGVQINLGRDWRVLLGGVSFGFLFIAAATALMAQHSRQARSYRRLRDVVAYYDNVSTAFRIRTQLREVEGQYVARDVVESLIGRLLAQPEAEAADEDDEPAVSLSPSNPSIKGALDVAGGAGKK